MRKINPPVRYNRRSARALTTTGESGGNVEDGSLPRNSWPSSMQKKKEYSKKSKPRESAKNAYLEQNMTRLDHPLYIDLPRKKWTEKKDNWHQQGD